MTSIAAKMLLLVVITNLKKQIILFIRMDHLLNMTKRIKEETDLACLLGCN